jgi:hypothetical protein
VFFLLHHVDGKLKNISTKIQGNRVVEERCLYEVKSIVECSSKMIKSALQVRLEFFHIKEQSQRDLSIPGYLASPLDLSVQFFRLLLNQLGPAFSRDTDNLGDKLLMASCRKLNNTKLVGGITAPRIQ